MQPRGERQEQDVDRQQTMHQLKCMNVNNKIQTIQYSTR